MNLKSLQEKVRELNEKTKPHYKLYTQTEKEILTKTVKLNEEVGELSAEILKLINYKHHNNTEEQIRQNLLEEAADSIIQVFDILADLKYTKEELIEASEKKIDKWLNQINK